MKAPTTNYQLPTQPNQLKVALVHDWLVGGGAEKVVEQLHFLYPDAPIYTSYSTDEWRQRLDNKVVTGWLQHFPKLRKFVPFLRIWRFTHLDLREYDVVISSSGAEAKGVKKLKKGAIHINYCHAPTHYYWSRYDEYIQHPGFGFLDPLARLGLRILAAPLRRWDYKAAQRPNHIIANSTHIQQEIKKYYNRDSTVIFPPIDTDFFASSQTEKRQGFIVVGRQTPYKRIDLAVAACSQLSLPLKVIGNGPDHSKLIKMAGPCIAFVEANAQQLAHELANAEAFIFPGLDDFGIAPIEAMAAGTPVIAYKAGGALDYVLPNLSGLFFEEQTVESLTKTLQNFGATKFDSKAIKLHAQNFSVKKFRDNMLRFIDQVIAN